MNFNSDTPEEKIKNKNLIPTENRLFGVGWGGVVWTVGGWKGLECEQ